jgi:hypothetical protein
VGEFGIRNKMSNGKMIKMESVNLDGDPTRNIKFRRQETTIAEKDLKDKFHENLKLLMAHQKAVRKIEMKQNNITESKDALKSLQ